MQGEAIYSRERIRCSSVPFTCFTHCNSYVILGPVQSWFPNTHVLGSSNKGFLRIVKIYTFYTLYNTFVLHDLHVSKADFVCCFLHIILCCFNSLFNRSSLGGVHTIAQVFWLRFSSLLPPFFANSSHAPITENFLCPLPLVHSSQ